MVKEIFLYSDFYKFTAEFFAQELNDSKGDDVVVRLYSNGGDVRAGYTMLSKMAEHGNVSLKVDGAANSMAAFMCCHFASVECLDISTFGFHRAAYWNERESDASELESLRRINSYLRKGFESKIDSVKFEKITGVSVDDLFNIETRVEVELTALQAKEVGLVDTIVPVTDLMLQAISKAAIQEAASWVRRTAEANKATNKDRAVERPVIKANSNSNIMTVDQFRSEHPELFREVVALGVSQEKDRAGAWLAFGDVDFDAVAKGIKEGLDLTRTETAEFSRKALSQEALANLESASAYDVITDTTNTNEEAVKKEEKINAFLDEAQSNYSNPQA